MLELHQGHRHPPYIYTCFLMTWHYLAGTFGAAVHNPVFLIVKQPAILPAHVFLFSVLHPPKGLLHD